MPLKEPWLIKTVLGATKPQLKADSGEAFMVKNIMVDDPTGNYITVKIEKTTVGYFRVGGCLGSHLYFRFGRSAHSHSIKVEGSQAAGVWQHRKIIDDVDVHRLYGISVHPDVGTDVTTCARALQWSGFNLNETLLSYLGKLGIFKGFPIAEGETMTIEGMEHGANSITLIEYELWEPGDIKPEMENGSKAKEYFFIGYGNTGGNIAAAGDHLYDTPATPAEFPDFPFGKVVPAKYEIDILGLLGSPFAPGENTDTDWIRTKFLKLVKDREVLFDEDRNGILLWARTEKADGAQNEIAEGFSLIGNYSHVDNNPPLMFATPLTFISGDELNIYLTCEKLGTAPNIDIYEQEIAPIMKVRRVE